MQTADFSVTGFRWDNRAKRYRWSTGAGQNQFAAKRTVLEYSRREIVRQSESLVGLADRLDGGDIDLEGFQRQAAETLKRIHVLQAVIAANGSENLFANDYLRIGRELKLQFTSGRSLLGEPFGLKSLAADVATGKVSSAKLKSRLKQYAASGKKTYWQTLAAKNDGKFGFRRLGANHVHCPDCIEYAAMAPKPIGEVILPGHLCSCLNQCRCVVVLSDSMAQAIRRKGG